MDEPVAHRKMATVIQRLPVNPAATALRPEGPADEPFLLQVYAGTRQEELAATGWPVEMQEVFLTMQFNAQQQGYRTAFPRAEFAIILLRDEAIGRIIIDRAENELRVVDIALLPAHRGRGIGTALVQNLQREAAAAQKPVRLSVVKGQRADRMYQRLGFQKTGEDGARDQLEWRGGGSSTNDAKRCGPA